MLILDVYGLILCLKSAPLGVADCALSVSAVELQAATAAALGTCAAVVAIYHHRCGCLSEPVWQSRVMIADDHGS
jgi:hypothetical protein